MQYPNRYLSKEYSDLLAKYSKDPLDPKSIGESSCAKTIIMIVVSIVNFVVFLDPLMNPDLYILLQSLIVS